MRTEYYFTNINDPKLILNAITDTRHLWDNSLDSFDEIAELRTEHTSVHRLLMNSVINLSQREFIDKKIKPTYLSLGLLVTDTALSEVSCHLNSILAD